MRSSRRSPRAGALGAAAGSAAAAVALKAERRSGISIPRGHPPGGLARIHGGAAGCGGAAVARTAGLQSPPQCGCSCSSSSQHSSSSSCWSRILGVELPAAREFTHLPARQQQAWIVQEDGNVRFCVRYLDCVLVLIPFSGLSLALFLTSSLEYPSLLLHLLLGNAGKPCDICN